MTKVECPQVQTGSGGHFGGHFGCRTKPIFERGREFDKSNLYMNFESDRVIDY